MAPGARGDPLGHPPRAVEDRCQHEPQAPGDGDRPPAAVAKHPNQPWRVTGRQRALQQLLPSEDRDQGGRTRQPQTCERQCKPRRRHVPRTRPAQPSQPHPRPERDQRHQPGSRRMQIRMTGALKLNTRARPVRQQIAQLMDSKRSRHEQRRLSDAADRPRSPEGRHDEQTLSARPPRESRARSSSHLPDTSVRSMSGRAAQRCTVNPFNYQGPVTPGALIVRRLELDLLQRAQRPIAWRSGSPPRCAPAVRSTCYSSSPTSATPDAMTRSDRSCSTRSSANGSEAAESASRPRAPGLRRLDNMD